MNYSIVVPFHNEEENLPILYRRLIRVMEEIGDDYELIFVDDGSTDRTQAILKDICAIDPRVAGIRLRRNFGQTAALAAGFDHAAGDVILAMDGDLQHQPEDIPRFLVKLDEGYDVVSGWRQDRQDGFRRTFPSRIANKLMARASGVPIHDFGTTFKAYRREVLERIPIYGQMHRFLPAMAHIEGASIAEIPIEDQPRIAGRSHYGLARTFRVMFDLLTIRLIVRYFARPLHFFGSIGAGMIAVSIVLAGWLLFKKLYWREDIFIQNGPMLLFAAVAFLGGVQFLGLGLLGDLFARLYYAPEQRSIYNVARVYRSKLPKEIEREGRVPILWRNSRIDSSSYEKESGMTVTIDLPQELERLLSTKANQLGLSVQDYLLQLLYTSLGNKPKNGAEPVVQRSLNNGDIINEPAQESNQSLMARLRKIKISATPDFSMKVDLYEPEGRDAK